MEVTGLRFGPVFPTVNLKFNGGGGFGGDPFFCVPTDDKFQILIIKFNSNSINQSMYQFNSGPEKISSHCLLYYLGTLYLLGLRKLLLLLLLFCIV